MTTTEATTPATDIEAARLLELMRDARSATVRIMKNDSAAAAKAEDKAWRALFEQVASRKLTDDELRVICW